MSKAYIVDWDIPMEKRRMFYYHLNKIKDAWGILGSMSSMSVMTVLDKDLALEVFNLASRYGRSSIYEAKLLDSTNQKKEEDR